MHILPITHLKSIEDVGFNRDMTGDTNDTLHREDIVL